VPAIEKNSFTISARGTIGFVVLHLEPYVPIVRLLVLIPSKNNLLYYLYLWAKSTPIEGNGTSQQQLTVPMVGKFKVLIPSNSLLDMFERKISSWSDMKNSLICMNELLYRQRDLLLPRLMSGKLEVE
jgi:type I restriction enzyme S subunit